MSDRCYVCDKGDRDKRWADYVKQKSKYYPSQHSYGYSYDYNSYYTVTKNTVTKKMSYPKPKKRKLQTVEVGTKVIINTREWDDPRGENFVVGYLQRDA